MGVTVKQVSNLGEAIRIKKELAKKETFFYAPTLIGLHQQLTRVKQYRHRDNISRFIFEFINDDLDHKIADMGIDFDDCDVVTETFNTHCGVITDGASTRFTLELI